MIRDAVLWLHKWLALISGVVVFILGITGCIYTFHDDLKLLLYPDKYFIPINEDNNKALPLSRLTRIAQQALSEEEKITRVDLYPAADRTWVFRAQSVDQQAFGHWNYFNHYMRVFLNPYTGEIAAIENSKTEFFQLVLQLHMNLLLGKKYGHPVVAYSTVIFIITMLSGLVLWWPKKWRDKNIRRSFWPKWSVKWKRLNHDLHNIIGFYALLFGLIIGITGLFFSFPNFKLMLAQNLNQLNPKPQTTAGATSPFVFSKSADPLDDALQYVLDDNDRQGMLSIRFRVNETDKIDIQMRLEEQRTGRFRWYYFDTTPLAIRKIVEHDKLAMGDRLASLNYDIHTGNIGGWFTKIIACLISLLCASLPVTGYIIWINKKKKRNKKRKRKLANSVYPYSSSIYSNL